MEIFAAIKEPLLTLLAAALTALFSYVGLRLKDVCSRYLDSEVKRSLARDCVQFVEQVFTDIHGEEKFDRAAELAAEWLTQKGIAVGSDELTVLLESAVNEMNRQTKGETQDA